MLKTAPIFAEFMMNLFEFDDYRTYLKAYLAQENNSPKIRKALLEATGMSTSFLTQVLTEIKQMSLEHAYEVSLHVGFTEKETDYFLLLVEASRAGSVKLRDRYASKLHRLRQEAKTVSAKVSTHIVLTEEQKATYYSSWMYTGVRNLIPTANGKTIKDLAQKLDLPELKVEAAVQFLMDIDFVKKGEQGLEYRIGYSHIDSRHPLVFRHHQNWRQRAIHKMDHYKDEHLHYTSPMALTKEAVVRVRAELLEQIKRINQSLQPDSEVAYCLNIDFFEY
jgi:uncharacterized protein (TIGR02147 family)